jgi:hypothetical protein
VVDAVRRCGFLVLTAWLVATACASSPGEASGGGPAAPTPSPSAPATPSSTPIPPVLYFNLTEEDALQYLENLDERIEEALHDGELGPLHDIYTSDGPARRKAAGRIIRNFRRRVVDRLHYEVIQTRVLKIRSQLAVFRQVREVHPCLYTYGDRFDVTPDHRILRQVVIRYMADERLNWKIDREIVRSEVPTGAKVTACPP